MVPWHLIEQEHNPDIAWDIWRHMFLDIADSHAPLKKKRVKGIGPSLASQIKDTSSNFTDYVTPAEHIFNLAKVSCQEVFNLIQKIPSNKASGNIT